MKRHTYFMLSFLAALPLAAQSGRQGVTGGKENLDLPVNVEVGATTEEDSPEIITFYGGTYEVEGIYYVMDRSGSMKAFGGRIQTAKKEVINNIRGFSDKVKFAVIFYNETFDDLPGRNAPVVATVTNKQRAVAWVSKIEASGHTCPLEPLLKALTYSSYSGRERNTILWVADGGATCPGWFSSVLKIRTREAIKAANANKTVINSIGIGPLLSTDLEFLRAVAKENNGTFRRILN